MEQLEVIKCQRCGSDVKVHPVQTTTSSLELCEKCANKFLHEMERKEHEFIGLDHFRKACNEILEGLKEMGFKLDTYNFADTPNRFARAYYEIFEGCINTQERIDNILSATFPAGENPTMVVAKDITCFSMCPHHILPVEYHVCVGYIPKENEGKVVGISKLHRLVELLAKRPMLQETFTQEIVNNLAKLNIKGAMAIVEGQHCCMRMRGAKAITSTIETSAVDGVFKEPVVRQEFMNIITNRKKFNT